MPTAKYEYIYICWIHNANANDMIMCSSKCGRDMSEKMDIVEGIKQNFWV